MFTAEGPRWLGLLPALGVLAALLVWYAVRAATRARDVVTAWGAVSFLIMVAGSYAVAYFVGLTAGSPHGQGLYGGDAARNWLGVVLALVGLAAGLFVTLADEPVPTGGSDDVAPEEPVRAAVPVRVALAAVLAMALPVATTSSLSSLARARQNGWTEAALVVGGLVVGAALLFVVLVADVDWAPAAFLLVAATTGLTRAFPDVLFEQFWLMFASGLCAGLLLPAGLRLLGARGYGDRGSLARGVLLALLVLTLLSGLSARGAYTGF